MQVSFIETGGVLLTAQEQTDLCRSCLDILRQCQILPGLTFQLLLTVTQQIGKRLVNGNLAFGCCHGLADVCSFKHMPEHVLAYLQRRLCLLALRDIAKIDDNGLNAGFGNQIAECTFNPEPAAVLMPEAVLESRHQGRILNYTTQYSQHLGKIIRMGKDIGV